MDNMEIFFIFALGCFDKFFKSHQYPKFKGYIYKITNNKISDVNDTIGTNDINCMYIGSSKYIKEKIEHYKKNTTIDIKSNIEIIASRKCNTQYELSFFEDYHIYLYNSIRNGLNMKYNTELANIVMNDDVQNKLECIQEFIKKHSELEIKYKTFIHNNTLLFNNLQNIREVYTKQKLWIKNNNVSVYNPFMLSGKCICEMIYNYKKKFIGNNLIGIYLIYWENVKKYITICARGGIKTIFKSLYDPDNIINHIINNGSIFNIYPVMYFRIKMNTTDYFDYVQNIQNQIENDQSNVINKRYEFITNMFDNLIINKFTANLIEQCEYGVVTKIQKHILYRDSIQNAIKLLSHDAFTKGLEISITYKKINDHCDNANIINNGINNVYCINGNDNNNMIVKNDNGNDNMIVKNDNDIDKDDIDKDDDDIDKDDDNDIDKDYTFRNIVGRPHIYQTEMDKIAAKKEASKKWRLANKDRIRQYNKKKYMEIKNDCIDQPV